MGYRESAFTIWEMSYDHMREQDSVAASLLELLSFLYFKDICSELYQPDATAPGISGVGPGHITRIVSDVEANFSDERKPWILAAVNYTIREALSTLLLLCLINRIPDQNAEIIGPVVHVWARERLNLSRQIICARDAVLLLGTSLPNLKKLDHMKAWQIPSKVAPPCACLLVEHGKVSLKHKFHT